MVVFCVFFSACLAKQKKNKINVKNVDTLSQTVMKPVWDVWEAEQLAAGSVPQVSRSPAQSV